MEYARLCDTITQLQQKIAGFKKSASRPSRADTRRELIDPLLLALGWDAHEIQANVPAAGSTTTAVGYVLRGSKAVCGPPALLLEVQRLGSNLSDTDVTRCLADHLQEMRVRWGVLSDGDRYIALNPRGGASLQDQRFLDLELSSVSASGDALRECARQLMTLLSRNCLADEDVQKTIALERIVGVRFSTLVPSPELAPISHDHVEQCAMMATRSTLGALTKDAKHRL